MSQSDALFERAKQTIPGGVNSPVRAFKAVGGTPRFMTRSEGAYIWDADGQRYIDYVLSWGPMIMGHNHPEVREAVIRAAETGLSFGCPTEIECEVAELLCQYVPQRRAGSHVQLRDRSDHERPATRSRSHRPRQNH